MKQLFLLFIFCFTAGSAGFAQFIYSPCKDSLKVEDIFYHCYDDYNPVCGCDGVTYRNSCSAENQYALSPGNWTDGPCTNFDYDISPNQVFDILNLKLKKIQAGYFVVTIFDVYGHIYFTGTYNFSANDLTIVPPPTYEISVSGFEQGLYIIQVISDGEEQIKKFFKVNL